MADLDPKRWHHFGVAALAAFMATLDSSIVNLANPTLAEQFQVDISVVAWVQQSYLLVTMAFLLIGGRLLDLWGERGVFVLGYGLFTLGSALCAFSVSIYMLIVSRAFQGLGAAILMSANQGLVARSFPLHQRGRTLGMIGTVVSVGLASGPPLGGLLIDTLGWRSIFYINVPIGVAAILFCLKVFSRKKDSGERAESFDWSGASLIVVGLGALFVGLSFEADRGIGDGTGASFIAASLVVLCFFILNERRSPNPILPLPLFGNRFFTQSCAASYLAFFAMISSVFLMPFYLQDALGFGPGKVGLVMMALPASMLLVAPLGGWISDKIGSRGPASFGQALVGCGLLLLHGLDLDASTGRIVIGLSLIGIGMGFFGSPNSNAILSGVPRNHVGIASGISALMRTSGIAFGIAFSAAAYTLFRNRAVAEVAESVLEGGDGERMLYLEGIRPVFMLAALVVAVNIINSITRGPNPKG